MKSYSAAVVFFVAATANAQAIQPPSGGAFAGGTLIGQGLLLSNNGQTNLNGAQLVMDKDESGGGFNGYNYLTFSGHSATHNFGPAAFFQMQSSRGTRLAPSSTLGGDWLFGWSMYGYDAADNSPQFALGAQINVTATADWTVAGVHPSRMELIASQVLLENQDSRVYLFGHDDITEFPFISGGCPNAGGAQNAALCSDGNSHTLRLAYSGGAYSPLIRAVDTFTSGSGGATPASGGGTANFLRADATWAPPSGTFVAFTTKTSGTTITLTSTTHSAYAVACGAGGGGGGTTTAAASAAVGGGGAAGACVGKRYASLTPSASLTIAIGTAGTAGSSSGGDGGLGGDSTFSDGTTVITGKGGNGGKGETAGSAVGGVDGGAGVIGTLGDWNGAGAPGTPSVRLSGLFAVAGTGGSCAYGAGGIGSGATGTGATALGRCSGGGGGNVENNSAAVAGGAGTGGVVLVWEYQ